MVKKYDIYLQIKKLEDKVLVTLFLSCKHYHNDGKTYNLLEKEQLLKIEQKLLAFMNFKDDMLYLSDEDILKYLTKLSIYAKLYHKVIYEYQNKINNTIYSAEASLNP